MRIWPFLAATYLGMLPFTLVYASMGSVFLVGGWVSVVIGIVFAVLFVGLPLMMRRRSAELRALAGKTRRDGDSKKTP
jgi:uncharacterized membrane protein YdjX (TVP38/TMEM64 family)